MTKMLSDVEIKKAASKDKPFKMGDLDGLFLLVNPNGSKLWRIKYRFGGKEKSISLGEYPRLTLQEARKAAFQAKAQRLRGIDPAQAKQDEIEKNRKKYLPATPAEDSGDTLEVVALEWFEKFKGEWVDSHASKIIRRMERDLFPRLGSRSIVSIKPIDLLEALRKVEERGSIETAHRLLQNCGQVWRYATATGRIDRDITGDLRGALPPSKQTNLGSITDPKEITALLNSIKEYKGTEVVRMALQMAPHVFVRPGELRQAKWDEFDFENNNWNIPAGRMKAKRPHVVPLSKQVITILQELRKVHGSGYLFPSPRSITRCLSDVALLAAIRRMGYSKEEMTAHGFRAMASTNLEQIGFDSRLIELQLAHADQDSTRVAYKRETHLIRLDERRLMMQRWSDWLDDKMRR